MSVNEAALSSSVRNAGSTDDDSAARHASSSGCSDCASPPTSTSIDGSGVAGVHAAARVGAEPDADPGPRSGGGASSNSAAAIVAAVVRRPTPAARAASLPPGSRG
eukprot:249778-Chlamydomonas_euryale.AAC.2